MTIDEAIEQERDGEDIARGNIIKSNNLDGYESWHNSECIKCAEEHEQIAEWLEELKAYREIGTVEECRNSVLDIERAYNKGYADGSLSVTSEIRNKVIDDFAERLSEYLNLKNATKYGNENAEQQRNSYDTLMKYEIADAIDDVAKRLNEV